MREALDKVVSELRGTWRFRWSGMIVAWAVLIFGCAAIFSIRDEYESMARVYVDTRTALRPLLENLAVEQDVVSQLNMVRQALLSRPNLEKVARETDLDLRAKTPEARDSLLNALSTRIQITSESTGARDPRVQNTFYRITYRDPDRNKALQVVDVLLNSFVEDTMGSNRVGSESAQRFLRDQLRDYEQRLGSAETKLAEFKKQHLGLVPGAQGSYFDRLQNENQELKRLESLLAVATSRRRELERQRRGEAGYAAAAATTPATAANRPTGPDGAPALDTATRIQQTQARLDEMLLRFTPKHPDVIAAQDSLDELKRRREEEIAAVRRGDPGAALAAGVASNPLFQSIQLAINQADVEIASLQGDLNNRRGTVNELRQLVNTAPEVEAEYSRLTRDYDVTKAQYTQLLQRLEQARISEDADQSGIVRFDVIDPPISSHVPVFPARALFLLGVFVLAVGVGVGVAFVRHRIAPVFPDARSVTTVTGLPVLGEVAAIWREKREALARREYLRYAAAASLMFVFFALAFIGKQTGTRIVQSLLS